MSLSSYKEHKLNNLRGLEVQSEPASNPIKRRAMAAIQEPRQQENVVNTHIISGYFEKEKSYKEMVIARINTFLCGILALLVTVCLVSYYFVATGEIELNTIRKDTLALNYDNEEMQNKLDNMQSYSNVDKAVTKTNMLQRAKQVVELSAASLPSVNFNEDKDELNPRWFMGY